MHIFMCVKMRERESFSEYEAHILSISCRYIYVCIFMCVIMRGRMRTRDREGVSLYYVFVCILMCVKMRESGTEALYVCFYAYIYVY